MDCLESRIEELVDEVISWNDRSRKHPPLFSFKVHAFSLEYIRSNRLTPSCISASSYLQQKKRLNCTASETSVASILMSLSNIEKNDITLWNDSKVTSIIGDHKIMASTSESCEEESDSADIPSSCGSVPMNTQDHKEALDCYQDSIKEKSICSPVELEGIRREKNRMHAKQTRLRKKKMTSEMESVRITHNHYHVTYN